LDAGARADGNVKDARAAGDSSADAKPEEARDARADAKPDGNVDASVRDTGTVDDAQTPPVDASTDDDSGATYVGLAEWTSNAVPHRCARLQRFAYDCPANGTAGNIWGNYIYSDDSSICTAAVHDGKISLASGGRIVVEMRPGENIYRGVSKNNITSQDYTVPTGQPSWPCSFVLWPW